MTAVGAGTYIMPIRAPHHMTETDRNAVSRVTEDTGAGQCALQEDVAAATHAVLTAGMRAGEPQILTHKVEESLVLP